MSKSGTVVIATAGRDKGRPFAVLTTDDKWAFLADGKRRPLERPKRKSLRHLQETGVCLDPSAMATNRELRRALRKLQDTIS